MQTLAATVIQPHEFAVAPKTATSQVACGHLGLYPGHHGRQGGGIRHADDGLATQGLKAFERRGSAHDAPELTDAVDVVVVGAAVVLVVVLVALEVVVEAVRFVEAERATLDAAVVALALVEDTVLDVAPVEEDPVDRAVVCAVVVVGDAEANTVWAAASVSPRVANTDPLANQNVTARALRIPRLRGAPGERSEEAMSDR